MSKKYNPNEIMPLSIPTKNNNRGCFVLKVSKQFVLISFFDFAATAIDFLELAIFFSLLTSLDVGTTDTTVC